MRLIRLTFLACLALLSCSARAIVMPAPPPELSETLTDYRTKEQLNVTSRLDNDKIQEIEEISAPKIPFVPGDAQAGILRNSFEYRPALNIGVPYYGITVLRFYDLQGVPYAVENLDCEKQGFLVENTASPSELVIKQNGGASSTKMKVTLENLNKVLIFNLSPIRLKSDGVEVTTLIDTINIQNYANAEGYVYPHHVEFPQPNPKASPIKFDRTDFKNVEETMLEAVRGLGSEE